IPLQEEDKPQFAFTWEGVQYTFNRLPQGYKHSPTIAHNALARILKEIDIPDGISVYQYIDDILIGGDNQETVKGAFNQILSTLTSLGLEIPYAKCQGPSQEVKFLGVWWCGGAIAVPADTLEKIEAGKAPENKKELQQILGTLSYWRKHVPGFSIIARSLYKLIKK
ncbi:POL5 protein, partial [Zapornia atra]|nr:POL5 protein [Zapornia atra]